MKEKSIEGTIKQLELILKARKIHKECVGESCINCNPDIEALTNSIEFLSDYKRVLKENEELRGLIAHKNGYTKKLEEDLFENCSNYVIPVQKIKDKIEELEQKKKKCTKIKIIAMI